MQNTFRKEFFDMMNLQQEAMGTINFSYNVANDMFCALWRPICDLAERPI